jgi:hypothetical protein
MSRDAGDGSSGGFVLSGFWSCGACPESEAVVSGLEDVTVVSEAIQQGRCHLGVAEHAGPLAEAQVGGDDDAGALVEFAESLL